MKKKVLSDWYEKLVFWRRMLFNIAAVAPVVPQPGATIYINICAALLVSLLQDFRLSTLA